MQALIWAPLALGGCDGGGESVRSQFECAAETDGWERCDEGLVQWCHALSDPHFHAGRDCARDGLLCVVGLDHLGYCAAEEDRCDEASTAGECVEGAAYNCVEGRRGERRCGVGKTCEVFNGLARCVDR
jgi:hypothetical protein